MTEDRSRSNNGSYKVEFTPPCKKLKKKAGSGGVPDHLIERGQTFIKDNNVDFIPFARQYLENIEVYIEKNKTAKDSDERREYAYKLRQEIMSLKAHGGMFNYEMISQISGLILRVLENTEELNDDLIKIIAAHNNTIYILITEKIKVQNDIRAIALFKEMEGVINRYNKKYL